MTVTTVHLIISEKRASPLKMSFLKEVLLIFGLYLCFTYASANHCPTGVQLSNVFCGLSPFASQCPPGYYCEVAPNDAYAVCCPRAAQTTLCGTKQPLTDANGVRHFCGRGGTRCPSNYHCLISPTDVYAVCCPN